jgi:hypothetical protein
MKLLTVIYDAGVDESLMELVDGLNLTGFTKLFGAHGNGGTGRKLGTPIFPGENNVLLLLLPDGDVPAVADALYRLQATYRLKPGLTLVVQDALIPPRPRDLERGM